MNKQHPLTDEIILELVKHVSETTDWNNCDEYPSTLYARAAADWQLEQVIEWIKQGHLYDLEYHTHCLDMIADLKKAMRPQEES